MPCSSTTVPPAGADKSLPMAAILPSTISKSVFSSTPLLTVCKVASFSNTAPCCAAAGTGEVASAGVAKAAMLSSYRLFNLKVILSSVA